MHLFIPDYDIHKTFCELSIARPLNEDTLRFSTEYEFTNCTECRIAYNKWMQSLIQKVREFEDKYRFG